MAKISEDYGQLGTLKVRWVARPVSLAPASVSCSPLVGGLSSYSIVNEHITILSDYVRSTEIISSFQKQPAGRILTDTLAYPIPPRRTMASMSSGQ